MNNKQHPNHGNIVDILPSKIYVVDVENYDFIYINENMKKLVAKTKRILETNKKLKCYEAIYGYDSPCHFCKIDELKKNPKRIVEFEAFNEIENKFYKLRENLIRSSNGKMAKYSIGEDVTELKTVQKELTTTYAQLLVSNEEIKKFNDELQDRVKEEVEKNREAERTIFEQAKMAQLGEMIGNIAHQWRQPLSAISTSASGMQLQKELGMLDDEDFTKATTSIVDSAQYLSKTIDDFRNFISQEDKLEYTSIQNIIDSVINIIITTYKHLNIDIIRDIDYTNTMMSRVIIGEISQVIINILNNAKDVLTELPSDVDKWVKISLGTKDSYLQIAIEDNGGGIPKDVLPKIFNPYYTTKHQSQGTGIGLYMSYDIVTKHHKGNLYAKNTKNGAKFFIEIPFDRRDENKTTNIKSPKKRKSDK